MMYCIKNNILIFTALLIILKFAYSHKVPKAQNVTINRVKRSPNIYQLTKFDYELPPAIFLLHYLLYNGSVNYEQNSTEPRIEISSSTESHTTIEPAYCKINIKKLHYKHSILISPHDFEQFHYPNDDGDIRVIQYANLFLSCPGDDNRLANYSSYQFASIKCEGGIVFTDPHDKKVDFDNTRYVCQEPPESKIRLSEQQPDGDRYKLYEIGFYIGFEEKFLKLMTITYDNLLNRTDYVISDISKSLAGKQKTSLTKRFDPEYYDKDKHFDMDFIYNIDTQKNSFENQFICQRDGKCNYFDISKEKYFDRGHLTPKSSFVYTAAAAATFKYLNTAPQWKVVNNKNWRFIENHVATMATTLKEDIQTVTGALSWLPYEDYLNVKIVKLFFTKESSAFVVPRCFYKLVYLAKGGRGVVYVTVNDPNMILDELFLYIFCQKPMYNIEGGKSPSQWKPKHIDKGYSYICEVPDFLIYNNELKIDDPKLATVKDLLYIPSGDPIETLTTTSPATSTTTTTTSSATTITTTVRDELKK